MVWKEGRSWLHGAITLLVIWWSVWIGLGLKALVDAGGKEHCTTLFEGHQGWYDCYFALPVLLASIGTIPTLIVGAVIGGIVGWIARLRRRETSPALRREREAQS